MKLDKVAILIKKASLEFDKLAGAVLAPYGLTNSQYKVLKYVYAEHGVRITDLETYFSLTHPTAIGIVHNLEKKGLVGYRDNPDDARSHYIVPTEAALAKKAELEGLGMMLEKELTKNLTNKERLRLVELLRKMLGIDSGQGDRA